MIFLQIDHLSYYGWQGHDKQKGEIAIITLRNSSARRAYSDVIPVFFEKKNSPRK